MDHIEKIMEQRLLKKLDYTKEATDEEVLDLIDNIFLQEEAIRLWKVEERIQLKNRIFYTLRRLDILQTLLEDPQITEIMINGKDHIFVEKEGKIHQLQDQFESKEKLVQIIQKIVAQCNRTVNESTPIVDARLKDGSRVNVVLDPVAIDGPVVTIRRFPDKPVSMENMIHWGSISKEAADELRRFVKAGYNIFISGGTGSGKTTFLNVLSGYIPPDERIITIEDSAELQIQGVTNLVRMETRNENVEGCNAISIRDLIRTSLRMRPDRIIVGEVRGSEAVDMMTAFNTGHDGSMSTGHANSAKDMLFRLQTMILMGMDIPLSAVKQQIASAVDIIVHLGRLRDKSRKILEITEVLGYENDEIMLHTLYRYQETGQNNMGEVEGMLIREGDITNDFKLKAAGMGL